MKAYHLRTLEPEPGDHLGLETFNLDSIYIPEDSFLIGIGYDRTHPERKVVSLLGYSEEVCLHRAQCIVDGNKEGVRGQVVSEISIDSDMIRKIRDNASKYIDHAVHIPERFDSTTDGLIKILTGSMIKKEYLK